MSAMSPGYAERVNLDEDHMCEACKTSRAGWYVHASVLYRAYSREWTLMFLCEECKDVEISRNDRNASYGDHASR